MAGGRGLHLLPEHQLDQMPGKAGGLGQHGGIEIDVPDVVLHAVQKALQAGVAELGGLGVVGGVDAVQHRMEPGHMVLPGVSIKCGKYSHGEVTASVCACGDMKIRSCQLPEIRLGY